MVGALLAASQLATMSTHCAPRVFRRSLVPLRPAIFASTYAHAIASVALASPTTLASIYANGIATFLLLSAFFHIFLQRQVSYWLTKPAIVRFIGACLLLFSLPCLCGRGWYCWALRP